MISSKWLTFVFLAYVLPKCSLQVYPGCVNIPFPGRICDGKSPVSLQPLPSDTRACLPDISAALLTVDEYLQIQKQGDILNTMCQCHNTQVKYVEKIQVFWK